MSRCHSRHSQSTARSVKTNIHIHIHLQRPRLVEVTLLGDLVRVLRKTEAHHSALVEQEILANAHRAALVQAQREAAAHQAGILTHQRAVAASAIRSEMRAYNCVASHWQALPLLNGDPFPVEDAKFPANLRALRTMPDDQVRLVAALYGIGDGSCHVDDLRDDIRCFVTGRRS
ncbi:hypothetical protein C8Q74DRAFT_1213877 [Fomes fomentarius]|nr:hypothetical protein C8Q74DRAFT_1213877 [Fomes fomentarius]